jgi:hypothetical protein
VKYEEIAAAIAGLEPVGPIVTEYEYQRARAFLERWGIEPTEQAIAAVLEASRQESLFMRPHAPRLEPTP